MGGRVCKAWCVFWVLALAAVSAVAVTEEHTAIEQLQKMDAPQFARMVRSAEGGDVPAQALLGVAYLNGLHVPRDDKSALQWFSKAAKKGNSVAQNNLALFNFYGREVPQSYPEALKWFREASAGGHAMAQYNLALMYHHGYGTAVNLGEAAKWYEIAARQGLPDAQNAIAYMYEHGDGVVRDTEQAVKWYMKASDQNYAPAQFNLGMMYMQQNEAHGQALAMFQKAATRGHKGAIRQLVALYLHGHCMPVNYRAALHWLLRSKDSDDWYKEVTAKCMQHLTPEDVAEEEKAVESGV